MQRTTGKSGRTITESEQKRPLMLPQELREMPFEKLIIMMRGRKPIYADKIHYFQESPFLDHLKRVSPALQAIKGIPTKSQLDDVIASGALSIEIASVQDDTPKASASRPTEPEPESESEEVNTLQVDSDVLTALNQPTYDEEAFPEF
ncbi:coupling protein VirD4 ATPase [Vibrio astriarenae]|nr:coupling protein VirD4 ATPase [Vibrio sp. C7]